MQITYTYGKTEHRINLCWVEKEQSIVFRNILRQLERRHRMDLKPYSYIAAQLDDLDDSIYSHSSALTTETMTSYDPTLPRRLIGIVNQMDRMIHTLPDAEEGGVLFTLYDAVFKRFVETVNVYLDDNRLKNKERMKLKREEKRFGKRMDIHIRDSGSSGFEDIVLQLTDVSSLLDCLTPVQKRRLLQHVMLRETIAEIARRENAGEKRIEKSISAALRKLRRRAEM